MNFSIMRFQQVHLDFRTHGDILGVSAAFDAAQFRDTLLKARVNLVTMFSKCHYGWSLSRHSSWVLPPASRLQFA